MFGCSSIATRRRWLVSEEVAECGKCIGSACCGRENDAIHVDTIVTAVAVAGGVVVVAVAAVVVAEVEVVEWLSKGR